MGKPVSYGWQGKPIRFGKTYGDLTEEQIDAKINDPNFKVNMKKCEQRMESDLAGMFKKLDELTKG